MSEGVGCRGNCYSRARPYKQDVYYRMSPVAWWDSRDALTGDSQLPGASSVVTALSVSHGVWILAVETPEK